MSGPGVRLVVWYAGKASHAEAATLQLTVVAGHWLRTQAGRRTFWSLDFFTGSASSRSGGCARGERQESERRGMAMGEGESEGEGEDRARKRAVGD